MFVDESSKEQNYKINANKKVNKNSFIKKYKFIKYDILVSNKPNNLNESVSTQKINEPLHKLEKK